MACAYYGWGLLNFRRLSHYGFLIDKPVTPRKSSHGSEDRDISMIEMYRTFNMEWVRIYCPPSSVPLVEKRIVG